MSFSVCAVYMSAILTIENFTMDPLSGIYLKKKETQILSGCHSLSSCYRHWQIANFVTVVKAGNQVIKLWIFHDYYNSLLISRLVQYPVHTYTFSFLSNAVIVSLLSESTFHQSRSVRRPFLPPSLSLSDDICFIRFSFSQHKERTETVVGPKRYSPYVCERRVLI